MTLQRQIWLTFGTVLWFRKTDIQDRAGILVPCESLVSPKFTDNFGTVSSNIHLTAVPFLSHRNNVEKWRVQFVWNQCQWKRDFCIHYDVSLYQLAYLSHLQIKLLVSYDGHNDEIKNNTFLYVFLSSSDTIAPTIFCPVDFTRGNDPGKDFATVQWVPPVVHENTGRDVDITSDREWGGEFEFGETEVTLIATDDAGNSANCTFTVTVIGELSVYMVGILLCGKKIFAIDPRASVKPKRERRRRE